MYWIIYQHLSVGFVKFHQIYLLVQYYSRALSEIFPFSGHISGRPGVPAKGHLELSEGVKNGKGRGEEIKKLSAALRAP